MIRKLIVPAALLALSACAASPTEPAARTVVSRADASGGYLGSGNVVEVPAPAQDAAPQTGSADGGYLGSGNAASGGYLGSGN